MSETSRRRGMNPLLAFILGFVLAFVILVGAVAGGVFYLLNFKLDNIKANKSEDGSYIFINADPSSGGVATVLDLISKISEMSKGYSSLTIGELENLIPITGTLCDKLEEELSKYMTLEEDELRAVTLGGLSEYVNGLAERINVAKLLGTSTDNAILMYMSYGIYGVYHDGADWYAKYRDVEGEHDCVLELDEQGKITGVYYYSENEEKVYTPYLTLENAKTRVQGVCEELTIGEMVPLTEGDRILGSIKNSTVNTISEDINNLCIQQIFANEVYASSTPDDGNYPEAQVYLAVYGEEPALATVYGGENVIYYEYDNESGEYALAGNNGKLTAEEFEGAENLYTLGEGRILYDPSYLYYTMDEEGDIQMVGLGTTDAGRAEQPQDGEELYTYGSASPLWKLLLVVDEEEQAFTFNNVGSMITNVSKNTQNTPMRELDAAGILTFDNKDELELQITYRKNGEEVVETLGDMPLGEVIGVAVMLFSSTMPQP
ncbi:MAG: hypothetical protein K2H30_03935 [Clostridia bacterium]|nr:hypothetical protein [Clostridia bacterium]